MFQHRFHDKVSYSVLFDWLLLTFLAGCINAGGFLACHRFVSHVTGFATLTGISLVEDGWIHALAMMTIPAFFLGGVIFSGYLTEKKLTGESHGQRFAPVMGLVAVLLGVVIIFGTLGYFGDFGKPVDLRRDYLLLAILCCACGLQNAAISSASGSTIRTTHLTGLTTDLGLGIVRAEIHPLSSEHRSHERRANMLRLAFIASFILGSCAGAFLCVHYQYRGFCLPMAIATYATRIAKYPDGLTMRKYFRRVWEQMRNRG